MSDENESQGSSGADGAEDSGEMIGDDKLPEDLTPSEDNPLAQGPKDEDEKEDGGGVNPNEQGMT